MRPLFVMLGAVAAAAAIWAPTAATAHASLKTSNPAQGAQVQTMPEQVSLTLTEPIQKPSFVEVTSPDGARMNSETVTVLDDTVTSAIDLPAAAGTYTMTYRIVSADNHTVSGTIDFEVLTPDATTAPPPAEADPSQPAPSASPLPSTPPADQPQVLPSSGGSTTARDALTIVAFSVVTMTGLILALRAGLKSAGAEDDD